MKEKDEDMNEQKPLVFFFFLSLSPRGTGQTWVSEMEKSGSAKTQGINEWFGRDQRKSTGKMRPKEEESYETHFFLNWATSAETHSNAHKMRQVAHPHLTWGTAYATLRFRRFDAISSHLCVFCSRPPFLSLRSPVT